MISGFNFYSIYHAVNLHFKTDSYDFFKHNGKSRITEKTFIGRNDKYFYERFGSKFNKYDDAVCFIVSNIVAGKKHITEFDMKIYDEWVAKSNSSTYKFQQELEKYITQKNNEVPPWDTDEPVGLQTLVNMVYSGELSKEFPILLNYSYNELLFKELDKTNYFLWNEMNSSVKKYAPFIKKYWNVDKSKQEAMLKLSKKVA
jgi:hypothetical protein